MLNTQAAAPPCVPWVLNVTPSADVVVTPDADLLGPGDPSGTGASAPRPGRRTASTIATGDSCSMASRPAPQAPPGAEERKRRGSTPGPPTGPPATSPVPHSVIVPIKSSR